MNPALKAAVFQTTLSAAALASGDVQAAYATPYAEQGIIQFEVNALGGTIKRGGHLASREALLFHELVRGRECSRCRTPLELELPS